MQDQRQTWIPISQATAQMWALDAMADSWTSRRRLMPALRRAAAALGTRVRHRSSAAPHASDAAHAPPPAVHGPTDQRERPWSGGHTR